MEGLFSQSEVKSMEGVTHDEKRDLCGVNYREADTQRDELTRCSIFSFCLQVRTRIAIKMIQ